MPTYTALMHMNRAVKMWAAVRENGDFCTCGSNNWENGEDRWVHAARGLASTE